MGAMVSFPLPTKGAKKKRGGGVVEENKSEEVEINQFEVRVDYPKRKIMTHHITESHVTIPMTEEIVSYEER